MCSSAEPAKDRLDLTALKPLWQLYSTLMKQYGLCIYQLTPLQGSAVLMTVCVCVCVCVVDDKTKTQEQMAPEIIRAFTELFFIVENLAEVRPLY